MVLADPGPLLTTHPSSSPPKTPHWSYSAQTRSQNEEKNPLLCLVRRTESPAHADFGWLRSLAALVIVRLVVVPLQPRSLRRRWRVVGWADILLDVISGVENALQEGCPRTMTGFSQYWFSGHFQQVFSTPMHYPALTLTPTCGADRAS